MSKAPSWREYGSRLWSVFREDRVFQRFIFARQVAGLSGDLDVLFELLARQ